jgi:hypothetical protein
MGYFPSFTRFLVSMETQICMQRDFNSQVALDFESQHYLAKRNDRDIDPIFGREREDTSLLIKG